MTIKELIEALQNFSEETEVRIADFDRKGNLVFIDIDPIHHVIEYEDGFIGIGGY